MPDVFELVYVLRQSSEFNVSVVNVLFRFRRDEMKHLRSYARRSIQCYVSCECSSCVSYLPLCILINKDVYRFLPLLSYCGLVVLFVSCCHMD